MGLNGTRKTVLVVDDEKNFCASVKEYLREDGVEVIVVHTAADCLEICSRTKVDVALLDQRLPDDEGYKLCPSILRHNDQTKIIFTTAYPSFDNAVKAVRAGAYDYLSKPFELEELGLAVDRALRVLALEKVEQLHNYRSDREIEDATVVGVRGGLREIDEMIGLAARSDAPVLITGETGAGKNVVAQSIHYRGLPKEAPFISINCSVMPENLIEAELFGYARGAFTGASADRRGIFEMAEGGSLFLDEIGEMPMHLQSKLLGVLEDKKIKRLGEDSIRKIDVRIIAATGIDLEDAIAQKRFRRDLYYRLGVIRMHIPPLRNRRRDIPDLCSYMLARIAGGRETSLSAGEIERLMKYDWPGNVRELKNVLERAFILQKGPDIRPSEFLCKTAGVSEPAASAAAEEETGAVTLEEAEERHIRQTLDLFSGNYSKTARSLGISLNTLKRKVKKYAL